MSEELPDGYQEDDVFDTIVAPKSESELSGYSSDDGGEFVVNATTSPPVIRMVEESSTSEETKSLRDSYFYENQEGHWNERFQSLVESAYFRKGEENYSAVRQYELSLALRQLCASFAKEASDIGVEIVKQMFLPVDKRTIRPITDKVGGFAGGEKFLYKSIFFKFPVDSNDIYGGDFFANKTAEHELKGLMAALDCRVEGLHVPLTALINYRGYSLIAQSWLPVDSNTIVYGTPDRGNTIYARSPEFNAIMKAVGEQINLKPHDVWNTTRSYHRTLYGPADLEGHIGKDNRCYILDCSRLFPPCAPRKGDTLKSTFLYRLLRPEFVKKWKTPLSSDAFSKFGKDYVSKDHNREVFEATEELELNEVPAFANHLDQLRKNRDEKKGRGGIFQERLSFVEELSQLVVDMRLRGINTRYLLLLLIHIKLDYNRKLITTELIARHIKNQVREKWRELGNQISNSESDLPYINIICDYFNSIFGCDSFEFWNGLLKEIEKQQFPLRDYSIYEALPNSIKDNVELSSLFLRLEDLLGLQLSFDEFSLSSIDIDCKLMDVFKNSKPFKTSHIKAILPKIKHINRITFEEGTALSRLAMMTSNDDEAARLLQQACLKYKEALAIRPNDTRALYNWGLSLSLLAKISDKLEHSNEYYSLAASKYKEALVINPKDRRALFMWANMISEQAKKKQNENLVLLMQKACQLYNRSLELLLPGEDDFDCLYNCGVSYLTRANELNRQKSSTNQKEIFRLLSIACERFMDAIQIQNNSVNSIHNLAVATAKRARILTNEQQRKNEYSRAFELYEKAYLLDSSNANICFDWGNALYRYAVSNDISSQSNISFSVLYNSFKKYKLALSIDTSFDAAFINLSLVTTSLLGVSCNMDERKLLLECTLEYLYFIDKCCDEDRKNYFKLKETSKRTLLSLLNIYKGFSNIEVKIIDALESIGEIINDNNNQKKSGSAVKREIKESFKLSQLQSSTDCGKTLIDDESSNDSNTSETRPRGLSCPSPNSGIKSVESPQITSPGRKKRGGFVFSRLSKLIRRKPKKDNNIVSLSSTINMECKKSIIQLNWNEDLLYSNPSLSISLNSNSLLVHQRVTGTDEYSMFLVHNEINDNQEYYLLLLFDESHIEKVSEFTIIEHPSLLNIQSIFRNNGKLYIIIDLAIYPFLQFYRIQLPIDYIKIYLAQLIISLETIQENNSDTSNWTFKLNSDRIFVDTQGCLRVLAMTDWKRSEKGKEEDLQKGLKYSSILYNSPEQLRGEPCNTDIWWSFGIFAYQLIVGEDPYPDESVHSILKLINPSHTFNIPPFIDSTSKSFLQQLLFVDKSKRLTNSSDIKKHPFFNSILFDKTLYDDSHTLPLPLDQSNFVSSIKSSGNSIPSDNRGNVDVTIREGQPLDTLIAPALKNDWAGFTLKKT